MNGHIRKRTTKSGISWQIVIEVGVDETTGKRIRKSKTLKGNKKEAEKLMVKMINELNSGTLVEESKITVAQYLRNWIKSYVEVNLSPTTQDGYRSNIEKHIIPHIGSIQLQQLKPLQIQNLYQILINQGRIDGNGGLSPRSIRYIHRNLREALEHAMRMQMISRNPASLVTIPKVKPYNSEVYDESEIVEMLEKVKGLDIEVPITISVTLGLRRGELLGLKWNDIDFDKKTVTIRNNLVHTSKGIILKTPKTNSSARTIDLPNSLVNLLRRHQKNQMENKLKLGSGYSDEGFVCCYNDGKPIQPKYFSRKFNNFLKRCGMKHIRLHDLRHSNATLMLKYGVPAKIASQRLGHSSIGITLDLYSHVVGDMQKEVADKFENELFSKVSI